MGTKWTTISEALFSAFGSARSRAKRSGMAFDLTLSGIKTMCDRQQERCAISGLKFDLVRYEDAFVKHPFAPSIDRIDSNGGYTSSNTRLVCVAVNFGLGQWGEEVFRAIAEATVRHQPPLSQYNHNDLDERIKAAEAILPMLTKPEAKRQRRRIAGLKRARTLGQEGLRLAAERAKRSRLGSR